MEPTAQQALMLAVQLAMGISLAACAGLRAFLPMLVVGVAGRLDVIPLSGSFEWLTSTPALVVFGVAVVTEVLADKIPGVDNFLDLVQIWVKPIAGTILVASVLTDLGALQTTVLGIVLGGATAGSVHILKSKVRLLSTFSTGGLGNPLVSVAEDSGVLVASVGAIIVPFLVFAVVLLVLAGFYAGLRKITRSLTGPTEPRSV